MQVDRSKTIFQIPFVTSSNKFALLFKRTANGIWQNRYPIFFALSISDNDLSRVQANIFDPESQAFTVAKSTSIHDQKHQSLQARKLGKQSGDLASTEDHRQFTIFTRGNA
jgi:hypothetical protein